MAGRSPPHHAAGTGIESGPLFEVEGAGYVANELSRGPWSENALHGGPVSALLAAELEGVEADREYHPGRFTLELHRPVPLARLQVESDIVRPGTRVRLLQARLTDADGALLATATLQQIRVEPGCGPSTSPSSVDHSIAGPHEAPAVKFDWPVSHEAFHSHATEHRSHDAVDTLGPRTQWIRVTSPLVTDRPLTPLQRAVAAADFANGISKVVPMDRFSFINPDLTVFLHRLPRGEWICVDARTTTHGEGVGLAQAVLLDEHGEIGSAAQTLLIDDTTSPKETP